MKHRVTAVVFLLMTVTVPAQQGNRANNAKGTIQLEGKVMAVSQLGEFSGKAIPVDIDPRFALTVRIDNVTPHLTELKSGSEVTFAIHSPALVFGDEPKNGMTYKFDLCRETTNGKVKFSRLGVRFKGGSIGGCGELAIYRVIAPYPECRDRIRYRLILTTIRRSEAR